MQPPAIQEGPHRIQLMETFVEVERDMQKQSRFYSILKGSPTRNLFAGT